MSGSTKTVSQTGGTKKGDSSVLPPSSTSSDKTNPTKTSSDAAPLNHDNSSGAKQKTDKQRPDSSTSDSKSSPSFMSTPVGQIGTITVVAVALCKYNVYFFI
jgi:hypothetical protein